MAEDDINQYLLRKKAAERLKDIIRKRRKSDKSSERGGGIQTSPTNQHSFHGLPDEKPKLIHIGGIAGFDESFLDLEESIAYQYFIESAESIALQILEDHSFYVFRTDTNAVLARGIQGFEAAKARANQIRKSQGLKWDQVKFKAERGNQTTSGAGSGGSTPAAPKKQFGVSRDSKTFTNTSGQSGRVDYAKRYNPSKGRRFRGYTDPQGNYHDID